MAHLGSASSRRRPSLEARKPSHAGGLHGLVDGGPPDTYADHLRHELTQIAAQGGALDLVILSHVDNDHVIGLLDFFADLRDQQANNVNPLIGVGGVWHNAFSDTIGRGNDITARLQAVVQTAQARGVAVASAAMALAGIGEGRDLRLAATALGFPINDGFPEGLVSLDTAPASLEFDNITVRVVGPTAANLEALRRQWIRWLDKHEAATGRGDPQLAAMADRSIPNLSSIMLLVEGDGRRLLLAGDGRGDHLLEGLDQAGLLQDGRLHVDLLKLPHHGSNRNGTKRFFRDVTADAYVASANGRDDNPDYETLRWIVETANEAERPIELIVTNLTPSVDQLLRDRHPGVYGYELTVMDEGAHSMVAWSA